MGELELAERLDATNSRIAVLFVAGHADDEILRRGILGAGCGIPAQTDRALGPWPKVRELLAEAAAHAGASRSRGQRLLSPPRRLRRRIGGHSLGTDKGTMDDRHSAIENCPLPMFVAEGEGHVIVHANAAFCALCGTPGEALIGRPLTDALPECTALAALLDRAHRMGAAQVSADLPRGSASDDLAYWSCAVWPAPGGSTQAPGLIVQVADTTSSVRARQDRERADAEIREMNQALIVSSLRQHELAEQARQAGELIRESGELNRQSAILEERNRMAREIHDTLAQAFVGVLLKLRIAERIAEQRPDEARALIEHVRDLAQDGLAQARRSVWALQPEAHEYSDLVGALSRTIDRTTAGTEVHAEFHVHGTPRDLPADIGMNLARIGEEALNNALRHGGAAMVWLDLTFGEDTVSLRVQDDGCGFDPARESSGGFGLISMQQRTARLGGQMALVSRPGRGTEVAVTVPVAPAEKEQVPA